ncbi:MAG: DUF5989 family protein [Phycisphaeraceae bacterium]
MTDPANQPKPSPQPSQDQAGDDLERQAQEQSPGLVREFVQFLGENKKWWLLPIIVVLLLFGVLFLLGPTVAPFIYTLF